jgi:hypothetical protein
VLCGLGCQRPGRRFRRLTPTRLANPNPSGKCYKQEKFYPTWYDMLASVRAKTGRACACAGAQAQAQAREPASAQGQAHRHRHGPEHARSHTLLSARRRVTRSPCAYASRRDRHARHRGASTTAPEGRRKPRQPSPRPWRQKTTQPLAGEGVSEAKKPSLADVSARDRRCVLGTPRSSSRARSSSWPRSHLGKVALAAAAAALAATAAAPPPGRGQGVAAPCSPWGLGRLSSGCVRFEASRGAPGC